jgi:Protein of unknown function (DUF3551)
MASNGCEGGSLPKSGEAARTVNYYFIEASALADWSIFLHFSISRNDPKGSAFNRNTRPLGLYVAQRKSHNPSRMHAAHKCAGSVPVKQGRVKMIRLSIAAALLAASMVTSNAFAQGIPPQDAWCLHTGGSIHCIYETLAQCQAARHGTSQSCQRNHQ